MPDQFYEIRRKEVNPYYQVPIRHYMYDVAVIGQGPAGGIAALRLAEAGHSVIAFDRKKV